MKRFFHLLCLVVVGAALSIPSSASARDYQREKWKIKMKDYTAIISSPFCAQDLPTMSAARAMSANRDNERSRFDFFALYASRGHESFRRLYDRSFVWVAVVLSQVPRRGRYDGRLMELEIVLHDGSRVRARETNSHRIGAGNAAQGSEMIRLEKGMAYREFVTQSWAEKQWQVFVGFDRTFDLGEVDRIEWGSLDAKGRKP